MPTPSSTLSRPQNLSSLPLSSASGKIDKMPSIYSVDQQVKFLHLQAEVDTLLLELQTLKQMRSLGPTDPKN
ncbi:MAG: hypothetical protein P5702_02575 [Limnospira sp. PMC 1291.21]|uniref:Uncharacterized protein n=3 Tax=Limnospira TaxID=2596745 RepID=A0A9P1KKR9_9CYAN|nr:MULTISPECIES: hypothetical protein [Limnospira]MDC0839134.1 hypothetical protein [Limnoraphis robusta]MDY7051787.1 hypothetical protein [Limnospira fusiformis LS22]QJB24460.1 hypothetical protein HFV01_30525 [Limnospira fusiformis SAG 85.79]UWU45966.1 hypothetical protein APLC1_0650 [Arthrospira platensis C1]CDM98107.1 conserved protein of unknown function [Limnospira indica PCC 8005]